MGESLSLADIWAGHVLYRYFTLDLPQDVPAGLQGVLRRPVLEPQLRAHVMVDYSELKARARLEPQGGHNPRPPAR
jgi:glutathione S-transferase